MYPHLVRLRELAELRESTLPKSFAPDRVCNDTGNDCNGMKTIACALADHSPIASCSTLVEIQMATCMQHDRLSWTMLPSCSLGYFEPALSRSGCAPRWSTAYPEWSHVGRGQYQFRTSL